MSINRKDTILIAVLMNVGLLTILFITAMSFDEESAPQKDETQTFVAERVQSDDQEDFFQLVPSEEAPRDEVDQVLKAYAKRQKDDTPPEPQSAPVDKQTVEVTVKRGDSLDKIARANKTTIRTIKELNELKTDRLRIGQVLKIPLPAPSEVAEVKDESPLSPDGSMYYELKSGDNPWKVAKKFHVSYDTIIELNDLNESRAKSLKPGDKIRIK